MTPRGYVQVPGVARRWGCPSLVETAVGDRYLESDEGIGFASPPPAQPEGLIWHAATEREWSVRHNVTDKLPDQTGNAAADAIADLNAFEGLKGPPSHTSLTWPGARWRTTIAGEAKDADFYRVVAGLALGVVARVMLWMLELGVDAHRRWRSEPPLRTPPGG